MIIFITNETVGDFVFCPTNSQKPKHIPTSNDKKFSLICNLID